MNSFLGMDNATLNIAPLSIIKAFIKSPESHSDADVHYIMNILSYRLSAVCVAERYVKELGLRPRNSALDFDVDTWAASNHETDACNRVSEYLGLVIQNGLTLMSLRGRKSVYQKATVSLAIACAKSGCPFDETAGKWKSRQSSYPR